MSGTKRASAKVGVKVSEPSAPQVKVAIFSGKGGVGKSTVSALLASVARDSVLIDCDPQASVSSWGDLRGGEPEVLSVPPTRLAPTLKKRSERVVIVDTPGALVSGTIDALKLMDLIVVVTPIDAFELAALNDTLNTAELARVPVVIVINRLHPQANAEGARELLSELGVPVSPVVLRERAVHRHALGEGRTCLEREPFGLATKEVRGLWEWLWAQLPEHLTTPTEAEA